VSFIINMAQAALFGGSTSETVSLLGTLGSPQLFNFTSPGGGTQANASWLFGAADSIPSSITRGFAQTAGFKTGDLAVYQDVHSWVVPTNFIKGPYYIKAALVADSTPDFGSTVDIWHPMVNGGSNVFWGWTAVGPIGTSQGTLRIDIANAQPEVSNIVATGYYRGVAHNVP